MLFPYLKERHYYLSIYLITLVFPAPSILPFWIIGAPFVGRLGGEIIGPYLYSFVKLEVHMSIDVFSFRVLWVYHRLGLTRDELAVASLDAVGARGIIYLLAHITTLDT